MNQHTDMSTSPPRSKSLNYLNVTLVATGQFLEHITVEVFVDSFKGTGVVILAGVVAIKSLCLSLSSTCFTGDGVVASVSDVAASGLGSSTVDQVLKYTKYPKYVPSTSTGQVLIF